MTKNTTNCPPIKLCECGCGNPVELSKLTNKKYNIVKGQPNRFINGHAFRQELSILFWNKVNIDGPDKCWEWAGSKNKQGYGNMRVHGTSKRAHRVSWEISFGEIPEKMLVCHHCDNPSCVNPNHLFIGTHKDNSQDCRNKKRIYNRSGTKNPRAKLTESNVREIRLMYKQGYSKSYLAELYQVNTSHIHRIIHKIAWATT